MSNFKPKKGSVHIQLVWLVLYLTWLNLNSGKCQLVLFKGIICVCNVVRSGGVWCPQGGGQNIFLVCVHL